MRICPNCGAFVGEGSKHIRRKRCKEHKGVMEMRRVHGKKKK